MAPNHLLKPETVHAKAKELIDVGKKLSALEVLYDMLKNRRVKTWNKSFEESMLLFVDLCIDLKRNMIFKRIIHQYRNFSVQECPQSLDDVLKHYFGLIKAKTEEARQISKDAVPDVEDLDILETPESLMLNAVSTEGAQGRSDYTILMPWLKFLWEAYRIGLDLVRNNSKFEHVYHRIARDAFGFCVDYRRRTEFRKLSEMLRMHTTRIQTQPASQNAISLTNSETQIFHFETRLLQLDAAMELEMYNEAFKIIEDIWSLVLLAKKIDRPSLMAEYYSKVAEMFLRSGYYLFHAAALYKRLNLYREHKRAPTADELSSLGSKALCAALAVPLPHSKTQFSLFSGEYNQAKQKALATLLGLSTVPTRSSLLADLSIGRVQSFAPPELVSLYQALETDFQPLKLADRVRPALERIAENPALSVYLEPLHEVIVSKTLLQLSQVYRSLHFSELVKLCPYYNPLALERSVIALIYNLELPMRVDHRRQAIIFDVYIDLGISQKDYTQKIGMSMTTQTGTTDKLSRQLALFAQSLQQVTEVLGLSDSPMTTARDAFVEEYQRIAEEHHRKLLYRRYHIEDRKETQEKMQEERAKLIEEEEKRIALKKKQELAEDEAKLKAEAEERERQKHEDEKKRLTRKIALDRYAQLMDWEGVGKAALHDITEEQLDQFNPKTVMEKKVLDMAKKRRDKAEKANTRAKKLDHLIRAIRLEEIPLLRQSAVLEQRERCELHEKAQLEAIEQSKLEHQNMLDNKSRLWRMRGDVSAIIKTLNESSKTKFKDEFAEWEMRCNEVRAERMAERAAQLAAEEEEKKRLEEEIEREAEREMQREKARKEVVAEAVAAAERQREEEEAARLTAEVNRRLEEEASATRQRESAAARQRESAAARPREPTSGWNRPSGKPIVLSRRDDGDLGDASTNDWGRNRASNQPAPTATPLAGIGGFERKPRFSAAPSDTLSGGTRWGRKSVPATTAAQSDPAKNKKTNEIDDWQEARRK